MPHTVSKLDAEAVKRLLTTLLSGRRRIEFIPNPGNAGDALINAGAWQLFEQIGVASSIKRPQSEQRADTYIYSGGGNLIPQYHDARDAILNRMDHGFELFIVLPHTIRGNEDLLGRMDARFHVFCRDQITLAHVKAHAPRANVYLADDLAFMLDTHWLLSRWRRMIRLARLMANPRQLWRYRGWRTKIAGIQPTRGGLTLLRIDTESARQGEADPRMDLSACHLSDFLNRSESELVSGDFLTVLDRANTVVTDRLHVGIGASLLGKDVLLMDNSYGKNRALFELSMRDRFPRTRFEAASGEPATKGG